jgi:hypothetical protein
MPGNPLEPPLPLPRVRPAPEAYAHGAPWHLPPRKETTMIKRHSDVILEITAHDPDTIETDLNTAVDIAVDIAREHAMQDRLHGILVTQHGYSSYTVAVSRDVPYGQTHERRE